VVGCRRRTQCPLEETDTAAASPPPWQLEELHTLAKFSTASYGRLYLSMWDKKPQLLSLSEEEVIAKYTGGLPEWVLHRAEATLFRPGHFLAVDQDLRSGPWMILLMSSAARLLLLNSLSRWGVLRMVVVAIRGTLGVSDTLCDLTCESDTFVLADGLKGDLKGEVHSGESSTLFHPVRGKVGGSPSAALREWKVEIHAGGMETRIFESGASFGFRAAPTGSRDPTTVSRLSPAPLWT